MYPFSFTQSITTFLINYHFSWLKILLTSRKWARIPREMAQMRCRKWSLHLSMIYQRKNLKMNKRPHSNSPDQMASPKAFKHPWYQNFQPEMCIWLKLQLASAKYRDIQRVREICGCDQEGQGIGRHSYELLDSTNDVQLMLAKRAGAIGHAMIFPRSPTY